MKKLKKILAALLIAALVLAPVSALAAGDISKEEVIYVALAADGAVDQINAVNIFDLPQAGTVTDHGVYASVRNMNTTDPIAYDGQTAVIDAKAGRLYYEGRLVDTVMPWRVSIRYFMDGREYTAQQIAGMSGALEIRLKITEDTRCGGDFFESYALQTVLTLDTAMCKSIVAQGATMANVGGDKQLTYTILPGAGADISVTAQVTDFEMDAIAINGVALALDVKIDDSELMDKVTELLDAIEELDGGAGELSDGADTLRTGGGVLQDGADSLFSGAGRLQGGVWALQTGGGQIYSGASGLQSGAKDMNAGLRELNGGIAQLKPGLEELNSQSTRLTEGSGEILAVLQGIQSALENVDVTEEDMAALEAMLADAQALLTKLIAGLQGMADAVGSLGSIYDGYEAALASLREVIDAIAATKLFPTDTLEGIYQQLAGNTDRLAAALENLTALSGMAEELQSGLETVSGLLETYGGRVDDLPSALEALKAGAASIVSSYEELDTGIRAYTDGVAAITEGFGSVADGALALEAGSGALASGADGLYSGTKALLAGIMDIYNATGTLTNGAGVLDSAVADLVDGLARLNDGTDKIKDGTAAILEGTDGMDETIQERIDELLAAFTGGEREITSFVSEDNENVTAVQFVITAPAIQKPAPEEPEPADEKETTFWQKLISLF